MIIHENDSVLDIHKLSFSATMLSVIQIDDINE